MCIRDSHSAVRGEDKPYRFRLVMSALLGFTGFGSRLLRMVLVVEGHAARSLRSAPPVPSNQTLR
eukprot:8987706-Alexandrium_andersonii.AAC.1